MPTVTLNKSVVEKLVGKKLPLDQLKDRISMLGTDLDRIENDQIIVEIFPNRPDMLSEQGFARAFAAFIGIKKGLPQYDLKKSNYQIFIKDTTPEWPYVAACVIKGLKLDDEKVREIIQIQEKLATTFTRKRTKGGIGIYPLNKITFPVTFTAKSPKDIRFIPLGDSKQRDADEILKNHPKGKEFGHILKDSKRYPLFIDAKNTIMSMPPITNAEIIGKVEKNTKDLFIEATGPDQRICNKA